MSGYKRGPDCTANSTKVRIKGQKTASAGNEKKETADLQSEPSKRAQLGEFFIGRSEKEFISSPTTDDLCRPTAIHHKQEKKNKLEPHVNRAGL